MNFLRSLGNWALFLTLAILTIITTYITGAHLGYLSDIKQLNALDVAIESIGFLITVFLTVFALKSVWRAVGTSGNGIFFGVVYSSLLSLLITLRFGLISEDMNPLLPKLVIFIMTFLAFFLWGLKIIPIKTRVLMIFFGKVLEGQELSDGIAWAIPWSDKRYFNSTTLTINLLMKKGDTDMPSFPNGTKLDKINLVFLYHMRANTLHQIINLGENWKDKIMFVVKDSLRSSVLTACYIVTQTELKRNFLNSYSVFISNSVKIVKILMSYGVVFPSVKKFPFLLEDAFWKTRAIATYDRLFFESKGYTKKVVVSPDGIRESVTVDATGEEPTQLLKDELALISDEEKIQDIVDKDIKIFTISHLQRDAIVRNGKSITNMPQNGIFQEVKKMGIEGESLNIISIDIRKDIEQTYEQIEKEEAERRAEEKHADTHTVMMDLLLAKGVKPDIASVIAGKMQNMDLSNINVDIRHFTGNSELASLGALISQVLGRKD